MITKKDYVQMLKDYHKDSVWYNFVVWLNKHKWKKEEEKENE